MIHPIETHSGESFRETYIQPKPGVDALLKADFDRFFMVRIEEMSQLMKPPIPPLRIQSHILAYLTEGEAVMSIGHDTYRIGKDECLIVPAGQVFSFDRIDVNSGYLCSFHNDFVIGKFGRPELLNGFEFLRIWGNPRIRLDGQTSAWVAQLCHRLLLAYSAHGLRHVALIQSYLLALLCEINQVYQPASEGSNKQAATLANRFRELLVGNVRTKQLVSEYASLLHITPNHLNKSVKAATGKSPTKWIDEAIILEAKVLLHQTNLSVGEVAAEVGIADPSYFSRLFKKYEGMTPVAFQRLLDKS